MYIPDCDLLRCIWFKYITNSNVVISLSDDGLPYAQVYKMLIMYT